MEFLIAYGYIGVFIASFLAATILPFSSEVVLTGVLLAGSAYWPCMIAATLGNFLGGMSCYWLGMLGKVEWIEKYLKLDPVKLQKVQDWIKGKGSWMGFFVLITRELYLARNHFKRNCPLFRELDSVIDKIRDRITGIFVYEFCKLGSLFCPEGTHSSV